MIIGGPPAVDDGVAGSRRPRCEVQVFIPVADLGVELSRSNTRYGNTVAFITIELIAWAWTIRPSLKAEKRLSARANPFTSIVLATAHDHVAHPRRSSRAAIQLMAVPKKFDSRRQSSSRNRTKSSATKLRA